VTEHQEIVASQPPDHWDKPPTDWSFVWRPGWILSHLFVAACVVAFVLAGFWQLSRLQQRKDANAVIRSRETSAPVPLSSLIGVDATPDQSGPISYRLVTVTGRYDTDAEVLIRNRTSSGGDPGWWLMTPLITADGSAVAVNRGWVPYAIDENGPLTDYAPPDGVVTVTGLVYPTQNRQSGPVDNPEGTLRTLSRVDLTRWAQQLDEPLYPVYVNLQTSDPAQPGQLPEPVPAPTLDEGPHLNYAGQWFIFATLTVIVYPLLLRRTARHKAVEKLEAAHADLADDPDETTGETADRVT
jgi:cytochrome oxidase assembly protein ShyY1